MDRRLNIGDLVTFNYIASHDESKFIYKVIGFREYNSERLYRVISCPNNLIDSETFTFYERELKLAKKCEDISLELNTDFNTGDVVYFKSDLIEEFRVDTIPAKKYFVDKITMEYGYRFHQLTLKLGYGAIYTRISSKELVHEEEVKYCKQSFRNKCNLI